MTSPSVICYFCAREPPGIRAAFVLGDDIILLKACSTCGRIHKWGDVCPVRTEKEKQYQSAYGRRRSDQGSSRADKFRNTKNWQRKSQEIRDRDMNMCRYCFLRLHRLSVKDLSVHHITPLEKNYSLRLSDNNLISLCRDCHEKAEAGIIPADVLRKLISERLNL